MKEQKPTPREIVQWMKADIQRIEIQAAQLERQKRESEREPKKRCWCTT